MVLAKNSKSTKNTQWNQQNKKLKTYSNSLFLSGLSMASIFCTSAMVSVTWPVVMSVLSTQSSTSFSPTSIPWIHNQSDCEYSGRNWSNNQCWDQQHSPTF